MHANSQIAVVGLAVMGQNLALNIARNGFQVTVYNRSWDKTEATLARLGQGQRMVGARTPAEVCASLVRPRKLILLVKAGQPVDDTIAAFLPHLQPGDLIVDTGNSHPDDTERRERELTAKGLRFTGMGVSGGEEGALNGPSLMPGGEASSYGELAPILKKIAAQVDDGPCVTHVGAGAAGHFVKMVHNGIEYGDMQLICEAWHLMRAAGLPVAQTARVFDRWNQGDLQSYLIEITARALEQTDPDTGAPVVDVILDKAGQKGTGRWTLINAAENAVPVGTIHAAVDARILSSMKALRVQASPLLAGPSGLLASGAPGSAAQEALIDKIHDALYASKIISYAQGLDLMRTMSHKKDWGLDLGAIAALWRGGCIIRARFLNHITAAYRADPALPHLALAPFFQQVLNRTQASWREVVGLAVTAGVPVPAFSASLAYYDSLRSA
ncbi:MAG: NADP-dependent phosphogluconate dehydrogenase, partial [Planctomycetota bacterium]